MLPRDSLAVLFRSRLMAPMRDVDQPFIRKLEPDDLYAAAECQELANGELGVDSSDGVAAGAFASVLAD